MFNNRGVKLGLFAAESQLELVTNDDGLNQWLNELVAQILDDSLMIGHFNQSYTGFVTVPELDQTVEGGLLSFGGGGLLVKGTIIAGHARGRWKWGPWNLTGPKDV